MSAGDSVSGSVSKSPKAAESTLSAVDDVLHVSNMTALQTYEVYIQLISVTASSETKGQITFQ